MKVEWLGKIVSFEEAEEILKIHSPQVDDASKARWEELKSKALPSDELRYFTSPPMSWELECGSDGYALVRNGQVVDWILYSMS